MSPDLFFMSFACPCYSLAWTRLYTRKKPLIVLGTFQTRLFAFLGVSSAKQWILPTGDTLKVIHCSAEQCSGPDKICWKRTCESKPCGNHYSFPVSTLRSRKCTTVHILCLKGELKLCSHALGKSCSLHFWYQICYATYVFHSITVRTWESQVSLYGSSYR